ncbi:EAL domain-containing protein [Planococcus shenhongbingii]|uniref:sensor domain-containing protein n=1 Tax=Planococcus shenhongbingii TaxID=3058398 RepID=UPI0026186B3A|nr:EAL domain-containing protein [Planococcus sp. N016]WKA58332.1 EAL domain-containing protein [Planococcus sp. N016]
MESPVTIFQKAIPTCKEPLLVVNENGMITQMNQAWINLCIHCQLSKNLWNIEENFFSYLLEVNKHEEVKMIKNVLDKKLKDGKQIIQLPLKNGHVEEFSVYVCSSHSQNTSLKEVILTFTPLNNEALKHVAIESVLENISEGFFLVDSHFNITYTNRKIEELFDCTRENIIGKSLWEALPETEEVEKLFNEYSTRMFDSTDHVFDYFHEPSAQQLNIKFSLQVNGNTEIYISEASEHTADQNNEPELTKVDLLTGLPHQEELWKFAVSLQKQNKEFALFFVNLINFKAINALYDYENGDRLIKNAAKRLNELAGSSIVVGRQHSDNFIVIRENTNDESITQFSNRIAEKFSRTFLLEKFQSVSISASIGISQYPSDSKNIGDLILFAETAMSEAKKVQETAYRLFHPRMNSGNRRELEIQEALINGNYKSDFYFTLQPQIDVLTGAIAGMEVLSRWNHPRYGELSPLEFIEIAEQSGAIESLTYHLLKKVFSKIKDWKLQYGWKLKTAINITPSLLSSPTFFNDFIEMMDLYGIESQWIEIEITEQVELTYSKQILENLLLCRERGISIAIDDFGTGYSMIAYLTQFPIDKIKIDKFFIEGIGQDAKAEAILIALINLAKSIGCDLLAEGVERKEEAEFLKSHGCTIFQGYLFDKPLKPDKFERKYLQKERYFTLNRKVVS